MNINLITGDLHSKLSMKVLFESDKLILSKFKNFVRNWYSCDGIDNFNKMTSDSAYMT